MPTKPKNIWEISEPSWLKEIKPDSLLNAKDLADIFKLSKTGVEKRILNGEIPPPDYSDITGVCLHGFETHSHKRFWRARTVRLLFKQLKEKQNGL